MPKQRMTRDEVRDFAKTQGWRVTMDRKEYTDGKVTARFMEFVKQFRELETYPTKRDQNRLENELLKPLKVCNREICDGEWTNETGDLGDEVCRITCYVYVKT